MERLTVLYDGSCGFCSSCKRWLEAQPAYVPLEFVRAGSPQARQLFPDLPSLDGEELTVVGDDGSVYRGAAAWIVCLWALEDYRLLSERLSSPLLYPLARQAFQRVSQNRREISRALALTPEEDLAQELRRMPAPSCGNKAPSYPTAEGEPQLGWQLALRVGLIFILIWTTLVLLVNHGQSIALWAMDRGIISSRAALTRLGLDPEEALSKAARAGDAHMVRTLLEAGVDPRRGSARGALAQAAIQNQRDIATLLRLAGADADAIDSSGETPLTRYAAKGDTKAIGALLIAGANPNASNL